MLAALALAASGRYGPPLAHLGLLLARAGLRQAAVAVAARSLVPVGARYQSFIAHVATASPQPWVAQAWYAGESRLAVAGPDQACRRAGMRHRVCWANRS